MVSEFTVDEELLGLDEPEEIAKGDEEQESEDEFIEYAGDDESDDDEQ